MSYLDGVQVVAKLSNLHPKDMEAPPAGVDDMTKLSYLHEPGVLRNLRTRYEFNEIYVSNAECRFPLPCKDKCSKRRDMRLS